MIDFSIMVIDANNLALSFPAVSIIISVPICVMKFYSIFYFAQIALGKINSQKDKRRGTSL